MLCLPLLAVVAPEAAAQSVPVLTFASSTYSVAENAGTVSVTVNASTAPSSALTVNLESDHETMDQHDYTAPETITFPANRTSHTFTVDILNDTFYELGETFTLTLEHGSSYTVGSPESTTVTINDDDRIAVRINRATYTVAEDADKVVFAIETGSVRGAGGVSPGNNDVPISLTLTPSDGTATGGSGGMGSGVDYDSDAINFTIPGGISVVYVSVPVTDDGDAEWDETFTVALTTGQPRVDVVSPSTTTVTITNDDIPPPRVSLHARDSIAREGGGDSATMALRLSRALGSGETLTVDYSLNLNAGASVSGTGVMLSSHTSGATSTGTLTITGPSAPMNKQDVRLQLNAAANTVSGSASGIHTADFKLTSVTGITGVGFVTGETSAKVFVKESSLSDGHNIRLQVFGGETLGKRIVSGGDSVTVLLPGSGVTRGSSNAYTVTLAVQHLTTDFDDLGRAYSADRSAWVAKPRRDTASRTDYYAVSVVGRKPAFVDIPVTDQSHAEPHERFRVFIAETPDYMGVTGVPNSLNSAPSVDFTIRGSLGNPSLVPPVPSDPAPASAGTSDYTACAAYLPTDAVSVREVHEWRFKRQYYAPHALRWDRVLAALGVDTDAAPLTEGAAPLTARESKANERQFPQERWDRVTRTLEGLEECVAAQKQGDCPEGQIQDGENQDGSPICIIEVPVTDYAALEALFHATGGPNWTNNTNWLSGAALGRWHGVRVAAGGINMGRVFSIDLSDNGLIGTIPPQLGDLIALSTRLDLSDNQLTGHIPSELSALTNLTHLDLSNNSLTGNIPAEFGDWTVIHHLYLQDNRLSGTLPAELTNIPFSSHLHLDVRNNAGICAPADAAFETWLEGIGESHGCGFPEHHEDEDHLRISDNQDGAFARARAESEPEAVPELSLSAGAAVDEGASAKFTVDANPAPVSDLRVQLNIAQNGDFATAGATGSKTVTVSASGSATLTVATVDDNTDDPDGSISVTIDTGAGYTVAASPNDTASVTVRDNDGPPPASSCVSDAEWKTVKYYYTSNSTRAERNYGANWYRVLIAFQRERADKTLPDWTGATARPTTPYTVKEAETGESVWGGWQPITAVLECLRDATVIPQSFVPLMPSSSNPMHDGVVRFVNRSSQAGAVRIQATDDAGWRPEPVMLHIGPGESVQLTARDLEWGNAAKGLTGTIGPGAGAWRLDVSSEQDIQVLPYIRAYDGLLVPMHAVAKAEQGLHRVSTFSPASSPAGSTGQASMLRLMNRGDEALTARITGMDDSGAAGGEVTLEVPARESVLLTAAALEGGAGGLRGALGDGRGMWRLSIASGGDLAVMNLLQSSDGHLTNLSGDASPALRSARVHAVPYFPAASDVLGRRGLVRIVNDTGANVPVRVQPYDDTGRRYEPLSLALGAGEAVQLNSWDLELGNASGGLSGSTGAGMGDWRLEIASDPGVEVLAYVRTQTGSLTPMHEVVNDSGPRYEVALFNPAGDTAPAGKLRIVNPGPRATQVLIRGTDDYGTLSRDIAWLTVGAGESRVIEAAELETGQIMRGGLHGALGDGTGQRHLAVESDQPILLMNLAESHNGQITNLSSGAAEPVADRNR